MASISLPPQTQSTMLSQHLDAPTQGLTGHSRRNWSMSAPLPNPPFVFPARDPDDVQSRPPAMREPESRSAAPLPAFSFNPGSAHAAQPSVSVPPPNRAGGHRRRCSEFVGGDHLVSSGVPESNQGNDENSTPMPANLAPPGPGFSTAGHGRRRGHAHRRSAAVSSVDLTAIRQALDTKPTIGSAPVTPADVKRENVVHDEMPRPSQSAPILNRHTPPASPPMPTGDNSPHHAKPATPGDSLPVDRPRSSSETAESTTTIQPEPTARNSEPALANVTPSPANRKARARPKTADASLMFNFSATDLPCDGSPSKRPLAALGHTRHKSLSAGILDAALRKKSPTDEDYRLSSSSDDTSSDTSVDDDDSPQSSKKQASKAKKKQKKVRSWAGSILTRGKGKKHHSKKDKSQRPKPPMLTRTNSDFGSGLDVNFDDDNIVVLRTPTNPSYPESSHPTIDTTETPPSLENSWKPRSFYEQGTQQGDVLSPVIDLDAALGPFNTPDLRSDGPATASTGFSAATKRMYSGGRRGEFVGPEMRYHRRAESAPEMPPFDRSALIGNRFSSNSVAENPDVFYEEEEDAFLAATNESPIDGDGNGDELPPSQALSSPTKEPDDQSASSKDSSDTLTREPADDDVKPQNAGLGIRRNAPPHLNVDGVSSREDRRAAAQQNAVNQIHQANNPFSNQPKTPVEFIKQEEWHHKMPVPPSPDVSPRFLPADKRPVTSPLEPMPPFSLHNGSSLPNSSFPSPDFHGCSPDGPRSITTSSTTDRKFSNPSYNMSMDFPHASIEDVPSLTSSASTMTNTMNRFSATFFPRRGSNDRSASFSAAVHRRSSHAHSQKRTSLASLSKLMVGPHAERSKLSYEEKPPGDTPEKTKKKGRRISRLMHFWRTKDKDKSSPHTVYEEQS
ncbi:hypothetical protein ASPWEDRAFT_171971 [Aspergillus wentii DTO 134E9]|uniref:Cell wall proline rich protein n=1 Tax=Aspergillus wentii DTO 134E9 TaxID=1073089 RepID=A0A1L9RJN6_ASPWE|nr:uncharacterized protein ASPWEDRAFT_171971 [Aspergillus wentii DTO 134E9]KAI9931901.1 hypothetical protein MW887_009402 [Aspergillus wentii]OJJ35142.1 hypothetical protein ASPWEDRAFT_171971 [Aspergillus wentii DTO 134E9]